MQTYFKMVLQPQWPSILLSTELNLGQYSEEIKGPIFYELKQDRNKKLSYYYSSKIILSFYEDFQR